LGNPGVAWPIDLGGGIGNPMGLVFLSKLPLVLDKGPKGLLKKLAVAAILVMAFAIGGVAAHLIVLSRQLPDLTSMADYKPPVTSKVFDQNGNLVARFYEERRTVVPVEQIPKHVKDAFISAEDEDFYNHKGIDYLAIVRCSLLQVKAKVIGGRQCGGSTITQQTAQTFLLSMEHNYSNKVKKLLLSKVIEEKFSKDEILHLYLNQIFFGNGAYGIDEAARTYYGVGVEKLTIAQAAALASVPKSPNRINPWADPARVRGRRGYVLGHMLKNGLITQAQYDTALKEPVRVDVEKPEFLDSAPYYAEAIRRQLAERTDVGAEEVTRGGLTVYAALDARLQKAANEAVQKGLRDLDKRQGYRGPLARLDVDETKGLMELFDAERARRFPPEETPELKKDELVGRPIWDLTNLNNDVLTRALRATVVEEEPEEDEAERKEGEPAPVKTTPPLRGVRTTKLRLGLIVGGVVDKVEAKSVTVDLGTTTGTLSMSSMAWARPFDPEKSTTKPRAPGDVLKRGDVVLVKLDKVVPAAKKDTKPTLQVSLEQDPKAEGALIAIEPHSRRVLALVGGYEFERSPFNRATQALRQPGSSFKPFIYAAGIETKLFNSVGYLDIGADGTRTQRLITDAPKKFYDKWTGKPWQPENSNSRFLGDITLRTCLTHSVNTCSISILERVGVDPVLELAKKLNLSTDAHPSPSNLTLALGTGEVLPIDIVNAYTIFLDEGRIAPPVLIEKVKRRNGEVLEIARPEPVQIISPQTAFVMSDLMKSVVESGTATRARDLQRPVAGKTGTTNQAKSVWFVGFTPDVVTGVYVGFDDNKSLGRAESGGKASVPIWLDFMKEATKELPARDFSAPEGVVRKAIDSSVGLLDNVDAASSSSKPGELPEPTFTEDGDPIPKELPKGIIGEVFISGTEPTQTAEDAPPPPLEEVEKGGLGP
jgi:penicillin-binding protein 1A